MTGDREHQATGTWAGRGRTTRVSLRAAACGPLRRIGTQRPRRLRRRASVRSMAAEGGGQPHNPPPREAWLGQRQMADAAAETAANCPPAGCRRR